MVQLSSLFFAATLFLGTIASPAVNANFNKRSTVADGVVGIIGAATAFNIAVVALPPSPISDPAVLVNVDAAVRSVAQYILIATGNVLPITKTLTIAEADVVITKFEVLTTILIPAITKLREYVGPAPPIDLLDAFMLLKNAYIGYVDPLESIIPAPKLAAFEVSDVDILRAILSIVIT
jgi:hypothetical protein